MLKTRTLILIVGVILVLGTFVAARAEDDVVVMDDGRTLKGTIIHEDEFEIKLKTGSGIVTTLSRDEVMEVKYGSNFDRDYARKFKNASTADEFFELGKWAGSFKRNAEAEKCFQEAIKKDPNHKGAREALGYIRHNDEWYTQEEFKRKVLGLVKFEDRWITPEDKAKYDKGLVKKDGSWVDPDTIEDEEAPTPRKRTPRPRKEVKPEKKDDSKKGGKISLSKKEMQKERQKRQEVDYSIYEDHSNFTSWDQANKFTTKHFIFTSNVSEKLQKHYGEMMEAFYKRFCKVFGIKKDITGIKIKIYGTHQEFMQHERKSRGVGGFFSPGWGVTCYHGRFGPTGTTQTVLSHEGTHFFQSKIFPGMMSKPIWIIEGMAVFFESSEYVDGEFNIGVIPRDRINSLKNGFLNDKYIKFDTLLNTPQSGFHGYHYAHAWAIVYYWLYTSKKNRKMFDMYLRKCKSGGGMNKDFFECCGITDVNEFEKDVKEFILRLDPDMLPDDAEQLYEDIQKAKKNGNPLPPIVKPKFRKGGGRRSPQGRPDPSGGAGRPSKRKMEFQNKVLQLFDTK